MTDPPMRPFVFLLFSIAWLAALSADAADEKLYAVGTAKVDITPDYPVRLNGFGFRRTESEGVTQRIWAKALAIGNDAEDPLVLITVDSLGLRMPMVDEVAKRLKEQSGIDRDRVVVTFSHSHTTPKINGVSDNVFSTAIPADHQAHIDRYTAELTAKLVSVAIEALGNRQPAQLEWAVGSVGFAKNRRTKGGPVDHSLPMLVVTNPSDGAIRAVYVTYACHNVTLSNNKISGDWAGFAQSAIEHDHPGAIALVSIGCGSDSNPDSDSVGGRVEVAAEQGGEIATEVTRLLKGTLKQISGRSAASLTTIALPLERVPSRELIAMAAKDDPAGYNAKSQLAKLDRGEELISAVDYPIQTWSFGDSFAMVFLAGEVCVDYSLLLNRRLDSDRVWLHGYSNDFCCYVPSERLLNEGGYGAGAEIVYFGLPAKLQAGLENKIITQVCSQIGSQFVRKTPEERKN